MNIFTYIDRINKLNNNKYIDYKNNLNKLLNNKHDGTYDLNTGKKLDFKDGYCVSFEQYNKHYLTKAYFEIVEECRSMCDGNIYIGIYNGNFEISFYTKDIEVAKKIMIKYNQYSIWSFKNRCNITSNEINSQ